MGFEIRRAAQTAAWALFWPALLAGAPALAQSTPGHSAHHQPAAGEAKDVRMADGEVRRIDKEQGKLTLRHGEIGWLDMPPMTMVYRVADAALLDKVKVGDKVKFAVEKRNDQFTVTQIEPAP